MYNTNVTGNYTVVVTDSNGCSNTSAPVVVTVNPAPQVSITLSGSSIMCEGDSVHMYANTNGVSGLSYQWLQNGAVVPWGTSSSYYALSNGIYNVVVNSLNGCYDTSAAQNVIINPKPVPVITASGPVLSTGSFSAYQWYLNNYAISGANSQNYTATQTGSYMVFVSDNNYCSAFSAAYDVSDLAVGSVISSGETIRIYPNPATSVIHIESSQAVNVVISSVEGKTMINAQHAKDIDINELAAGVYMTRVYDLAGTLLKVDKLVISR
jgi:hypothetical protein